MHISVVAPAYKCSECIEELYLRLTGTLKNMGIDDYELIFVNDGSPSNDWQIIKQLGEKDKRVKGLNLSRNFGQHKAITAGLDLSQGEWVIVMDCDLQDRPEEIPNLYFKAQEGYDAVFGKRANRKDGFLKQVFSKMFNKVFNYLLEQNLDNSIANFSILNKKVVDEIKKMREKARSHVLFVYWLGYNTTFIDIEHSERAAGKTSYTFKKSLNLAADFAISQSNKPLKMFIKFGFFISFVSFIYGTMLIVRYLVSKVPVAGWTSTMVSLYFIAGILLASMGVLGVYIGRIFDELKDRPIYAIKETLNI